MRRQNPQKIIKQLQNLHRLLQKKKKKAAATPSTAAKKKSTSKKKAAATPSTAKKKSTSKKKSAAATTAKKKKKTTSKKRAPSTPKATSSTKKRTPKKTANRKASKKNDPASSKKRAPSPKNVVSKKRAPSKKAASKKRAPSKKAASKKKATTSPKGSSSNKKRTPKKTTGKKSPRTARSPKAASKKGTKRNAVVSSPKENKRTTSTRKGSSAGSRKKKTEKGKKAASKKGAKGKKGKKAAEPVTVPEEEPVKPSAEESTAAGEVVAASALVTIAEENTSAATNTTETKPITEEKKEVMEENNANESTTAEEVKPVAEESTEKPAPVEEKKEEEEIKPETEEKKEEAVTPDAKEKKDEEAKPETEEETKEEVKPEIEAKKEDEVKPETAEKKEEEEKPEAEETKPAAEEIKLENEEKKEEEKVKPEAEEVKPETEKTKPAAEEKKEEEVKPEVEEIKEKIVKPVAKDKAEEVKPVAEEIKEKVVKPETEEKKEEEVKPETEAEETKPFTEEKAKPVAEEAKPETEEKKKEEVKPETEVEETKPVAEEKVKPVAEEAKPETEEKIEEKVKSETEEKKEEEVKSETEVEETKPAAEEEVKPVTEEEKPETEEKKEEEVKPVAEETKPAAEEKKEEEVKPETEDGEAKPAVADEIKSETEEKKEEEEATAVVVPEAEENPVETENKEEEKISPKPEEKKNKLKQAILSVLPEVNILELGATVDEVVHLWESHYPLLTYQVVQNLTESTMQRNAATIVFKMRDCDGSGSLDEKEVTELYRAILGDTTPSWVAEDNAKDAIENGDDNNDGGLTFDEYIVEFSTNYDPVEHLKDVLEGVISHEKILQMGSTPEEFLRGWEKVNNMPVEVVQQLSTKLCRRLVGEVCFKLRDTDNDGVLDYKDLRQMYEAIMGEDTTPWEIHEAVSGTIGEADENADHEISLKEFLDHFMSEEDANEEQSRFIKNEEKVKPVAEEKEEKKKSVNLREAILSVLPEEKIIALGATVDEVVYHWRHYYPALTDKVVIHLTEQTMQRNAASVIFNMRDKDENGYLDKKEVTELYDTIHGGEAPSWVTEENVEEVMEGKDGKLTFEEYIEAFSIDYDPDTHLRKMLVGVITDEDISGMGSTAEEFIQGWNVIHDIPIEGVQKIQFDLFRQMVGEVCFKLKDTDDDGVLDYKDLRIMYTTIMGEDAQLWDIHEKASGVIINGDQNDDQALSLFEFLNYFMPLEDDEMQAMMMEETKKPAAEMFPRENKEGNNGDFTEDELSEDLSDEEEYEKNIDEIKNMLDRNCSGTIDLKELEALYPDAAHFLLNRFDYDHSGDLSIKELKNLINSNKLASETLNRLKGRMMNDNESERIVKAPPSHNWRNSASPDLKDLKNTSDVVVVAPEGDDERRGSLDIVKNKKDWRNSRIENVAELAEFADGSPDEENAELQKRRKSWVNSSSNNLFNVNSGANIPDELKEESESEDLFSEDSEDENEEEASAIDKDASKKPPAKPTGVNDLNVENVKSNDPDVADEEELKEYFGISNEDGVMSPALETDSESEEEKAAAWDEAANNIEESKKEEAKPVAAETVPEGGDVIESGGMMIPEETKHNTTTATHRATEQNTHEHEVIGEHTYRPVEDIQKALLHRTLSLNRQASLEKEY